MSLKVAHLNVRSLPANFANVKSILLHESYDVLALSETWLSVDLPSNIFKIVGYELFRCDRINRGGGVAIYIKSYLRVTLESSLSVNHLECLWLRVGEGIIGVVYRPPNSNYYSFRNALEEIMADLLLTDNMFICMGDFNVDLLKYNDHKTTDLLDMLQMFDVSQIVEDPTRITATSSTLIDLIIVNGKVSISKAGTFKCDFSDHLGIYCILKHKRPENSVREIKIRSFKDFDQEAFIADLRTVPWHLIYDLHDVDLKVGFLNNNLIQVLNQYAPTKIIKTSKPPAPWLTYNIKLMMRARDNAFRRYRKSQNPAHFAFYKSLRNETNRAIKREKIAYFQFQCRLHRSNRKYLWREIKNLNLSNNKSSIIPEHFDVNTLNTFFSNSQPPQATDYAVIADMYRNNSISRFSFKAVSASDVIKSLKTLKSNATGVDGINLNVLNLCIPLLNDHVQHIFNYCIENSVYPSVWKSALITPIPKITRPEMLKDLRPISIIPSMGKVFEGILESQLRDYVNTANILPAFQSGFRRHHSCASALTTIVDDILSASDEGKLTLLILLDFSKAFDTINHKILVHILESIGMSDAASGLMASYLSDRTQRVSSNNKISNVLRVTQGAPQGAILSPLLFSIYTSKLPDILRTCRYHLYADDTQLYTSFLPSEWNIVEKNVNEDLDSLQKFSALHCLNINPAKTQLILFGPKKVRAQVQPMLKICINSQQIPFSNIVKNLGVYIDAELRFNYNTTTLIKRAFSMFKAIYINRHLFDHGTKLLLCESLALCHFNYSDVLYSHCISQRDLNRIQRLQNCCVRLIFNIPRRVGTSQSLRRNNILNMANRQHLHFAIFCWKINKYKQPSYLYRKFCYRFEQHTIPTRHRNLLTIPRHRHEFFKRSFSYNAAITLNRLIIPTFGDTYPLTSLRAGLKEMLLETQ